MTEVAEARALADRHLAGRLPRRWRHVQAVAAQAERVADRLGFGDGMLVAAAWLHDIGYGPDLVETGFHPLDGGRYLRRAGADDRLARLVAHHSCAVYEARVRGLERELLAEFDREESPTSDALVCCDMTTGPGGESVGFVERMDEIEQRYGPGDEVTRALQLSRADQYCRGYPPGGRAESPHVQVNRLLAGSLPGKQAKAGAIHACLRRH